MATIKIHEFFERYRRSTQAFFALSNILCAVLAAASAYALWQFLALDTLVVLAIAGLLLVIFNTLFSLLLFKVSSEPLRVLTQAVAHVSKDPVVTPPPELHAKRFQKSGLRELVQTIYELAISSQNGQRSAESSGAQTPSYILSELPCGVIALKGHQVVYSNKLAPVTQKTDGTSEIGLIFDQRDNFDVWLSDCTANKVHDTHLWLRVPNKLPGEEGQRIFDVAAYYQKDNAAGIDTILVAFDRSSEYGPDQEDMDFIALAAHELRGPITVIRGYLDVLHQELGDITPEQQQLIDRLQVSSERLSSYVNNILNVSRYDRQQFKVHLYEDSLLDIMKTVVPDLTLRASTQNRRLKFAVPPNLPTVAADRSALSEVITNLIDNAIKYSHDGGEVVIAASPKDDAVEITVTDNGIGMPANVMGNLFNRFYRSHRSRQQVGGTGLGLYICKAIIEAHGGTIWVRSVEDQGSVFGFTIPTYQSVADKLNSGDNQDIVQRTEGWIKNHAMYRR